MSSRTPTLVLALASALAPAPSPLAGQQPQPERVATGFGFTEGPAWDPIQGRLLFSDIRNDRILQLGAKDKVTTFQEPSRRANGLLFDRNGDLYVCQGGARQVVRIDPQGRETVLAAAFGGARLNSPNDLALDDSGGLYFTDPRYGAADDLQQKVMGVYHVSDEGVVTRVIDDLPRPNGVVIARDGSGLFVADTSTRQIHFYPILSPGRLGKGSVLFRAAAGDGAGPDGMALDREGRLYATYRELLVLGPGGAVQRRIPVPEQPSNCTIGGPDGRTLYITARTSLYRLQLDVTGAPDFVEPSWIGRRMLRHPRFQTVELDGGIGVGYGIALTDVDGDRHTDIVLVDRSEIAWYRNPGEGADQPDRWRKHVIARQLTRRDHVCVAARDLDGDGRAELAVGAGWNPGDTNDSGSVHYLVAPADPTAPWHPVALPHEPTVHRMRWVRDGKGGHDLVVAPLHGRGNRAGRGAGVKLLAYRFPGRDAAGTAGAWSTRLIDDTLHVTHNLDPVQWDRDPAEELLVCSQEGLFLFDRRAGGGTAGGAGGGDGGGDEMWTKTCLAGPGEGDSRFRGAGEVRLAIHAGIAGSRLLAAVEPFHGNQLVIYSPVVAGTPRQLWRRRVVFADMAQGHAIACADFNGDGSEELVVGWREKGPGGDVGVRLVLPHNARGERATVEAIDAGGMACEDLRVADLDGDGHPDIVAAGRATHNLRIYFNRTFR